MLGFWAMCPTGQVVPIQSTMSAFLDAHLAINQVLPCQPFRGRCPAKGKAEMGHQPVLPCQLLAPVVLVGALFWCRPLAALVSLERTSSEEMLAVEL